jgi:hypothetical protein
VVSSRAEHLCPRTAHSGCTLTAWLSGTGQVVVLHRWLGCSSGPRCCWPTSAWLRIYYAWLEEQQPVPAYTQLSSSGAEEPARGLQRTLLAAGVNHLAEDPAPASSCGIAVLRALLVMETYVCTEYNSHVRGAAVLGGRQSTRGGGAPSRLDTLTTPRGVQK